MTDVQLKDAEVEQLLQETPILEEKMIVDMVNGLEVSQDHIQYRKKRTEFHQRVADFLTGETAQKQDSIDTQFQKSLSGMVNMLDRVESKQILSYHSIQKLSYKLKETRDGVKELVGSHIELKHKLDMVADRHEQLKSEIQRIGLRQSAHISLDQVFDSWESGRKYSNFPPILQLYYVIEDLYRSPFGLYEQESKEFHEQLKDKCILQMKRITGAEGASLVSSQHWIDQVSELPSLSREAFMFIAEDDLKGSDVISEGLYTVAKKQSSQSISKDFPLILPTSRLSERLVEEIGGRYCG